MLFRSGTLSDGAKIIGLDERENRNIYDKNKITDILHWCMETGKTYWEYVEECEDSDIWDYLSHVWQVMSAAVKRGLESEGVLPGPLALTRKACRCFRKVVHTRNCSHPTYSRQRLRRYRKSGMQHVKEVLFAPKSENP